MEKLRRLLMELFVLAMVVMSGVFSMGQLTARAEISYCEGWMCWDTADCGPPGKCFCNRPTQTCGSFFDGEIP
jgi:hypothetical protein